MLNGKRLRPALIVIAALTPTLFVITLEHRMTRLGYAVFMVGTSGASQMKKYKFITMTLIEQKPKTGVYQVNNNFSGYELGIIKWYPPWRQYAYFSTCEAVYSVGCMEDINDFIKGLKEEATNE